MHGKEEKEMSKNTKAKTKINQEMLMQMNMKVELWR